MEIFSNYEHLPSLKNPIMLTIGNFDGVHLGHQKILHTLEKLKSHHGGLSVVLTFSNHPLEVIKSITFPKITPLEEKLALFKEHHVDVVILLEFSKKLQQLPYDHFIQDIRKTLPFHTLVLGDGASFGAHQKGTPSHIKELASLLHFDVLYLEKASYEGKTISSQLVREKLAEGDVDMVKSLLGRPFGIYAPCHLEKLQETGEHLLKVTFDFQNHCTIPSGYYIVNLLCDGFTTLASAHLTSLSVDNLQKTFDLEILIKGPVSPFMNDHIKIEFLRKISPSKTFHDVVESSGKIKPLTPS
ncbi:MAG: FAD synthetase family protein [Chlamydiae bacterium]|nr:FAD synthetase family protein [Chlamydiota bacterium]